MIAPRRLPATAICAVVSDVDGTLVTDDKILTLRTVAAVGALRDQGIAFAMISSRPPRGLQTLIGALGVTAPIAGFNGGLLVNCDLSVIARHLLSRPVARQAIDVMTSRGAQIWVFSGADWLVRDRAGPYVGQEAATVGFGPTLVDDFDGSLDDAAKIVGVSRDCELLAKCEGDARTLLADRATVARSQAYYLDITHPLANKGAALSALSLLLAVPAAHIAVIGDGRNDVAMFERSGLSIAMGNASEEVQRAADLVTDSNGDDGFATAVERFILGKDRPGAGQCLGIRGGGRRA